MTLNAHGPRAHQSVLYSVLTLFVAVPSSRLAGALVTLGALLAPVASAQAEPCDDGTYNVCSQCGGGAENPDCAGIDPCKKDCPGLGPGHDPEGKPMCGGGPCDSDYADNDPCSSGLCLPPDPGKGRGCTSLTCTLGQSPGEGTIENGSFKFRFGLGRLPGGLAAPTLWVHRRVPNADLAKPEGLQIAPRKRADRYNGDDEAGYADCGGVDYVYDELGALQHVWAPQTDVNIVRISQYEYQIRFYGPDAAQYDGQQDVWVFQGSPFVSWAIENPDGQSALNRLFITELAEGTTAVARYEYTYNSAQHSWTLDIKNGSGDLLRSETRTRTLHPVPANQVEEGYTEETFTVQEGGGTAYSWEATHLWVSNENVTGERLSTRQSAAGLGLGTELRTYWPDAGAHYWEMKSIVKPDGSWLLRDCESCYQCPGFARVTLEAKPWKNQAKPGDSWTDIRTFENTTGYAFTERDYTTSTQPPYPNLLNGRYSGRLDINRDGHPNNYARRPRAITEKINGVTVGKTYHTYLNLCGECTERDDCSCGEAEITERCVSSSVGLGNAANPRTITEYYSTMDWSVPPRTNIVVYPDGRWDTHCHPDDPPTDPDRDPFEAGTWMPYNRETGQPGSFTPTGGGKDVRWKIVHGSAAHPGGIDDETTTEVIVENEVGQRLLRQVYVNPFVDPVTSSDRLIEWTEWVYDERGRLTDSFSSNGRHAEEAWQDCCRASSRTDEAGVETEHGYDALGRPTYVTKAAGGGVDAVTTSYARSARTGGGYVVTTTVGDSPQLASRVEYDLAGQVVKTVDEAGLETVYGYTAPGADYGRTVTITRPDGATEITEYYLDGRVKSITGSGVVGMFYDYGVNNGTAADPEGDVEPAGTQWTRTRKGSGEGTAVWTETTTYDFLGRIWKVKRPGYNFATTQDKVITTYDYHPYDYTGNGKGKLWKVSTTGRAATLYEYDEMGNVTASGLDVNANDALDRGGSDRITETTTQYVYEDSKWWRKTVTEVYATDSVATASTAAESWEMLTGFDAGETSRLKQVDANGAVTVTSVSIARGTKTVTRTVTHPDSTTAETTVTINGFLQSTTSKTGLTTTYAYDDLGRQCTVTDSRDNATTTEYYPEGEGRTGQQGLPGQVARVTDAGSRITTYGYDTTTGRLKSAADATDKRQYFAYNLRGQLEKTWGHTTYPVKYEYDTLGRKWHMWTYREGTGWNGPGWPTGNEGTPDLTTWAYDDPTGLLTRKTYADATFVGYAYTADGKLDLRTWARGVVTKYRYDANTGEMTGVDYGNDAVYEVEHTYDRLGRRATVTDAVGTRTFGYNDGMQLATEAIDGSSGGLYSKLITRKYQTTGDAKGRDLGFQVGTDQDPDQDYDVTYHYDDQGRFARITGPGLPAYGVQYERLKDEGVIVSELVAYARYMSGSDPGTDTLAQTQRAYEGTRDLIDYVANRTAPDPDPPVSKYAYTNDALGRRVTVENLGSAFGTLVYGNDYVYNDRSELTESHRYDDLYGEIPAARRLYDYDNIGNRETDTDGDATPPGTRYTTNALNQYTMTRGFVESFVHDADGNMTKSGLAAGDFDADGDIDAVDFNVFQNCFNGPNNPPKAACTTLATDIDGDGDVDSADFSLFQGCYNGPNRPPKCNAGVRPTQYTWDAENRLIAVQPILPQEGEKKATFAYDYMGRRVQKQVYNRSASSWVLESDERFVYDRWNVVMVVNSSGTPQQKYTWGLDLSGLSRPSWQRSRGDPLHDAGGIGGLLGVEETAAEGSPAYWFLYDANGNVGQAIRAADQSTAARYEYDPYGNTLVAGGDYAAANRFGFSTKWLDSESRLLCHGGRYLIPRLGRWLSRDPIGERGGLNLQSFVANAPANRVDPLGLYAGTGSSCGIPMLLPPSVVLPTASSRTTSTPSSAPTSQCGCKDAGKSCDEVCNGPFARFRAGALPETAGFVMCHCGTKEPCICITPVGHDWLDSEPWPASSIMTTCAYTHEECHIQDDGCNYEPNDFDYSRWQTVKNLTDAECKCYKAEHECLEVMGYLCAFDSDCFSRIEDRMRFTREKCRGYGGDPPKYGFPSYSR